MLTVFNKLDRLQVEEGEDSGRLPWCATGEEPARGEASVFGISALAGTGVAPLLAGIEGWLERGREPVCVELPLGAGKLLAWLRRSGKVLEETYSDTAVKVTALVSEKVAGQLRKLLAAGSVI
jgi:50S ribosomal subunit-associated GTPase HflX